MHCYGFILFGCSNPHYKPANYYYYYSTSHSLVVCLYVSFCLSIYLFLMFSFIPSLSVCVCEYLCAINYRTQPEQHLMKAFRSYFTHKHEKKEKKKHFYRFRLIFIFIVFWLLFLSLSVCLSRSLFFHVLKFNE